MVWVSLAFVLSFETHVSTSASPLSSDPEALIESIVSLDNDTLLKALKLRIDADSMVHASVAITPEGVWCVGSQNSARNTGLIY